MTIFEKMLCVKMPVSRQNYSRCSSVSLHVERGCGTFFALATLLFGFFFFFFLYCLMSDFSHPNQSLNRHVWKNINLELKLSSRKTEKEIELWGANVTIKVVNSCKFCNNEISLKLSHGYQHRNWVVITERPSKHIAVLTKTINVSHSKEK